MNMREALERIAKYPMCRSEEMSIETAREIARAALASQAQQSTNLNAFIQKHVHVDDNDSWTYNSLASSAQDFIDSAVAAFESQAQQPEYTFDQLTKMMMQAATKEGHKVTMKIKWALPPEPEGEQE